MGWLFDSLSFNDRQRIEKRFRQLEDTLLELSGELGYIKNQLASLHAKYAVGRREMAKKDPNQAYKKMLGEFLGGDIVAITEPGGDALNDSPSTNEELVNG